MITEHDLQEAIAECEGQRNPTVNTCLKLAAFYTIRDKMFPQEENEFRFYSTKKGTDLMNDKVEYESKTEFGSMIYGIDVNKIIPIIDELMTTLKVLMPKLYNGVIQKIEDEIN